MQRFMNEEYNYISLRVRREGEGVGNYHVKRFAVPPSLKELSITASIIINVH